MNQEALQSENISGPEGEFEQTVDLFRKFRNDYIDDLPEEIVTFEDPNYYKYKCRGNWWHGVLLNLNYLESILPAPDAELQSAINEFKGYIEGLDYKNGKRRTREEIDGANERLDRLIELLS